MRTTRILLPFCILLCFLPSTKAETSDEQLRKLSAFARIHDVEDVNVKYNYLKGQLRSRDKDWEKIVRALDNLSEGTPRWEGRLVTAPKLNRYTILEQTKLVEGKVQTSEVPRRADDLAAEITRELLSGGSADLNLKRYQEQTDFNRRKLFEAFVKKGIQEGNVEALRTIFEWFDYKYPYAGETINLANYLGTSFLDRADPDQARHYLQLAKEKAQFLADNKHLEKVEFYQYSTNGIFKKNSDENIVETKVMRGLSPQLLVNVEKKLNYATEALTRLPKAHAWKGELSEVFLKVKLQGLHSSNGLIRSEALSWFSERYDKVSARDIFKTYKDELDVETKEYLENYLSSNLDRGVVQIKDGHTWFPRPVVRVREGSIVDETFNERLKVLAEIGDCVTLDTSDLVIKSKENRIHYSCEGDKFRFLTTTGLSQVDFKLRKKEDLEPQEKVRDAVMAKNGDYLLRRNGKLILGRTGLKETILDETKLTYSPESLYGHNELILTPLLSSDDKMRKIYRPPVNAATESIFKEFKYGPGQKMSAPYEEKILTSLAEGAKKFAAVHHDTATDPKRTFLSLGSKGEDLGVIERIELDPAENIGPKYLKLSEDASSAVVTFQNFRDDSNVNDFFFVNFRTKEVFPLNLNLEERSQIHFIPGENKFIVESKNSLDQTALYLFEFDKAGVLKEKILVDDRRDKFINSFYCHPTMFTLEKGKLCRYSVDSKGEVVRYRPHVKKALPPVKSTAVSRPVIYKTFVPSKSYEKKREAKEKVKED